MTEHWQTFAWDEAKAQSNWRKHGVTFETAIRAFADPHAIYDQDRSVEGEARWQLIGLVDGEILLMVAHTAMDEDGKELVRIVSARPATLREEKRYGRESRAVRH